MISNNGYGIAFAADNRSMQDGNWQYDSTKPKLAVDPNADPSHLKIFELDGGQQYPIVFNDDKSEILFQIKHKMPWPPMYLCYFYTEDAPSAQAVTIGRYQLNYALMRVNGNTWFEELYTQVDDTYFYIKHRVLYNGSNVGAQTSYGNQFKFRVRMEIIARKAVFLGGSALS